MAGAKISKTAKRSQGQVVSQLGKRCPGCGDAMVATKVIRLGTLSQGGMFWICQKCGYRERTRK